MDDDPFSQRFVINENGQDQQQNTHQDNSVDEMVVQEYNVEIKTKNKFMTKHKEKLIWLKWKDLEWI